MERANSRPARDPYRRVARFYDRFIDPLNAGVRDVALKVDPPQPGWIVLDVGCGTGTGLERYGAAGCELHGVDTSPAMLERARQRLGAAPQLQIADDSRLAYPNDMFDLVTTSMVLHEVPDDERDELLAEMVRVTKPEGHLLVVDFRFGSLRGLRGPAVKALTFVIERFAGHWSGYRSFREAGGFPGLAARTGLEVRTEKIVAGGNLSVYIVDVTV